MGIIAEKWVNRFRERGSSAPGGAARRSAIDEKVTAMQKKIAVLLRGYGMRLACSWGSLAGDLARLGAEIERVELGFRDPEGGRERLVYRFDFHQLENRGDLLTVSLQGKELKPQLRIALRGEREKGLSLRWLSARGNGSSPGEYDVIPNGNGTILVHRSLRCPGVVSKLPPDGGYGFVSTGGPDIFFMRAWVEGSVERGDEVTFIPVISPRGPQAHRVRKTGC